MWVDLDGAGASFRRFAKLQSEQTGGMLIVAGLLHANRFRAFIVLLCGVVVLTWAQRLLPDRQATLDPKQVVASAWTHQLPLMAFGLGAEAMKHLEADAHQHDAEPYGPTTLLGYPGEGWFPPATLETPLAER